MDEQNARKRVFRSYSKIHSSPVCLGEHSLEMYPADTCDCACHVQPKDFVKEQINPIVGSIYLTAKMMGLENAPNDLDWKYLKEGTNQITDLVVGVSRECANSLRDLLYEIDRPQNTGQPTEVRSKLIGLIEHWDSKILDLTIPRRIRTDKYSPAEKAIHDAKNAVEMSGADPRLTDAMVLLGQAQEKVADFIDQG